ASGAPPAFAARPSFTDWIRETTRAAGALAEPRDHVFGRAPLREPNAGAPQAQIPMRSAGDVLAERAGFEPAVEVLALGRFSKPLVEAAHPPLRRARERPSVRDR